MIRHLTHTGIDKTKWDRCIENSPDSCMFVYSWYLDIVCPGWAASILNDYEAVFPIAWKSKFKIHYIYQPFFTRYFGVFSSAKADPELLRSFLNSIPSDYKYMEFCLHESNAPGSLDFIVKERRFQELLLSEKYASIQAGYAENTKRSIKKAVKAQFVLKNTASPDEIVDLFKTTKGIELDEFRPDDYKILLRLMQEFLKRDGAETFSVYDQQNNLCAAAFFMKSKNRYVYLKSGVTASGRASGAMHYLIDGFIKKHAGTENILDFGGSSVETVARFYKSFGAKDCLYLQVKKDRLSRLAKLIRSLKS